MIKGLPPSTAQDIRRLRHAFNTHMLAHLCVDVQASYCDPAHPSVQIELNEYAVPGEEAIKANIEMAKGVKSFVKATRRSLRHFWVLHDHPGVFPTKAGLARIADREERRNFLRTQFYKVTPAKQDTVVFKSAFNAFYNTDLAQTLEGTNVKAMLLTGLYFTQCLDGTARGALAKGFRPFIVTDLATSGIRTEQQNLATYQELKNQGVGFVTRADIAKTLHV